MNDTDDFAQPDLIQELGTTTRASPGMELEIQSPFSEPGAARAAALEPARGSPSSCRSIAARRPSARLVAELVSFDAGRRAGDHPGQ